MSHTALDALKARLASDPAFAAQFRGAASLDVAIAVARAHGLTLDATMFENRPLGAGELEGIVGAGTPDSLVPRKCPIPF